MAKFVPRGKLFDESIANEGKRSATSILEKGKKKMMRRKLYRIEDSDEDVHILYRITNKSQTLNT